MVRTPRGRAASPAAWEHLGLTAPSQAGAGAHASGGVRLGGGPPPGGQDLLPWDLEGVEDRAEDGDEDGDDGDSRTA